MLVEKLFIEEFDADVYTYDVNGLCVIFVDKECDEFAFNATVNNKHIDNSGLPHIVEHCVFGGSSNYNIDEPFEYLVKTKKYKYLNAITYRDRTVYPFSTYDINDFNDILDVYLDAIFNANMSKETFEQECVRVDNGEYNGIVLNEMTEMYTDDVYKRECEILSRLENNIFKYNSAGEPNAIKVVKYEDAKKYYDDNYTVGNITISFYGKFEHNKYLKLISEKINDINKGIRDELINNEDYNEISLDEKIADEFINIKDIHFETETAIVITSKINNCIFERQLDLIFQCLIISSKEKIQELFKQKHGVTGVTISSNVDLCVKYLIVDIKHNKGEQITCESFIEVLKQVFMEYSHEQFDKELYEKSFINKNKDYGYKTTGLYTLLEISKFGKGVYKYYNGLNENNNRLPSEYKINTSNREFVQILTCFRCKHIQYNEGKKLNVYDNTEDIKKSEKNIDNLFFSSTNYDIINTIIVINLQDTDLIDRNVLDNLSINENIFKQLNFVMSIYSSRIKLSKKGLDGFYINIIMFTDNKKNAFTMLNGLLKNMKFEQLLKVAQNPSVDYSYKVQDILDFILKSLPESNKALNIDKINTIKPVEFEILTIDENNGEVIQITRLLNEKFTDNIDYLVYRNRIHNNLESNKLLSVQENKQNLQNELYKNFLIIDIEPFANNNGYTYDIDYMYLELVLEAMVNERLLEKIRFKNGAYEVNFKLLKLENKVVLYSNIDRNSETTLDIFKTELKNLNLSYLSNVEYYLNKITNNFYRNEQNKNIKTKKQFDNWILNINDTLTEFDYDKVEKAIYILKNSEIVGEFSFGKTNYKNYKNGGTYVY